MNFIIYFTSKPPGKKQIFIPYSINYLKLSGSTGCIPINFINKPMKGEFIANLDPSIIELVLKYFDVTLFITTPIDNIPWGWKGNNAFFSGRFCYSSNITLWYYK